MPTAVMQVAESCDGRCWGLKRADLKGQPVADPPATFQPREVELLVDFMLAKMVRQGPLDRAKCLDLAGGEADACREYK